MNTNQFIELIKEEIKRLNEGLYDKGIFKAVFLAGGPGSGKSYVAKQLFGIPDRFNISIAGLKIVNQDKEFKYLLKKYGFDPRLLAYYEKETPDLFKQLTAKDDSVRSFAKDLNKARMKGYMQGKLGMIIDGTGHDYSKIKTQKAMLEKEGYDTYMVFVNTSLEVAQQRNKERDRVLPEKIVKASWEDVQKNLGAFQGLFKNNFVIVDNSKFLKPKDAEKKFGELSKKHALKFANSPLKNPIAKRWVKDQEKLRKVGIKK